jgi:Ion channel
MYPHWMTNTAVVGATLACVALCVLLHYEGLLWNTRKLDRFAGSRRAKILYGIGSVLLLHTAEIWIFAAVLWLLTRWPAAGGIAPGELQFLDLVYFSAATYTTAGYGDLVAIGPVRFLAGTESLTGFVLITWSASFTYLEMEKFWGARR